MSILKKHIVLVIFSLAIAGCSSEEETKTNNGNPSDTGGDVIADVGTKDGSTDTSSADSSSDAGQTLVGACTEANPESCAYKPAKLYQPGGKTARSIVYTDITGAQRTVNIEIRRPMGAPQPSPLIVWSHGGSGGKTNPAIVGPAWGEVFTRAGFVSIAIAHEGRGAEASRGLCLGLNLGDCDLEACNIGDTCTRGAANEEIGSCVGDQALGGAYCTYMKPLNWDRPNDFREVLDWVEVEASGGFLDGAVDTNRIAYAGHSAGGGATMMVAGAARRYRVSAEDHLLMDTRPIAFMSCSPQGPDDDGFTTASFTRERCEELAAPAESAGCLTRPHLVLTGLGDGGEPKGENRRLSFDLAPDGDRYLGYMIEPVPQHTTFNYETDGCERYARDNGLGAEFPARCNTYRLWLRSAALAFFDATLRDDVKAKAYLASDNITVLSGAAFEWTAK